MRKRLSRKAQQEGIWCDVEDLSSGIMGKVSHLTSPSLSFLIWKGR